MLEKGCSVTGQRRTLEDCEVSGSTSQCATSPSWFSFFSLQFVSKYFTSYSRQKYVMELWWTAFQHFCVRTEKKKRESVCLLKAMMHADEHMYLLAPSSPSLFPCLAFSMLAGTKEGKEPVKCVTNSCTSAGTWWVLKTFAGVNYWSNKLFWWSHSAIICKSVGGLLQAVKRCAIKNYILIITFITRFHLEGYNIYGIP